MAAREVWKPIPGCKGYEASSLGRVRSVDRKVWCKHRFGQYGWRRYKGKLLAISLSDNGYPTVHAGGYNAPMMRVHSLVMLAFVGACPPGKEVAHWDGNKQNNRLSNLRYATHAENNADKARYGGRVNAKRAVYQTRDL